MLDENEYIPGAAALKLMNMGINLLEFYMLLISEKQAKTMISRLPKRGKKEIKQAKKRIFLLKKNP